MSNNPYLISAIAVLAGASTQTVTAGQIAGAANSGAQGSSAHDVIHVAISDGAGAGAVTVTNVTDSQGNTYRQINSDVTQSNVFQWRSVGDTVALVANVDTITVTFSGTSGTKNIIVTGIPGVQPANDNLALPASTASASATSASITSGTLSAPAEVAVAVLATSSVASPPTWASGWTVISTARQAGGQWLAVACKVVSSTAAVTASATFATASYGMLLSSYIIPGANAPYVAGAAQAPPGAPLTLPVPVRAPVGGGDTIQVGALATAGSVTGVTDSAGNTYALTKSETVNPGAQLYVFSSYNSNPMTPQQGAPGTARVGCTVTTGLYPGGTTRAAAAQAFDVVMGGSPYLLGYSAQKIYYQPGSFPTALQDGGGQDLTPLVTAECRFYLCYKPAWSSGYADDAALIASVQYWQSKTPNNLLGVILWQEPQNGSNNFTASSFIAMFRHYAAALHSNCPGIQVYYDAAGHAPAQWTSWYPGNSYADGILIDYYGNTWASQTNHGTTNLDPVAPLRNFADRNGKSFGFGEIGYAIAPATCTAADFANYMNYVTDSMADHAAGGGINGDVMWYAGNRNTPVQNTIQAGDPAVADLRALWNAIATSAPKSSVSVTYSSASSAQAAIVLGDNGVKTTGDAAAAATATTGTVASVATGALASPEEHIVAFEASLTAGGVPVAGDSLILGEAVQAGTAAYLTAAYKTVSTGASDTPSFTIASTTWSVVAVTDPVASLTITTVPPAGVTGVAYSSQMAATGGSGAITWSSSGTLPPGLTFSAAGLLSGAPATAGTYAFSIVATDSLGLTVTESVTVLISPGAGISSVPAVPLHNNILSMADQDFESGIGSWISYTGTAGAPVGNPGNATSLTNGSAVSVTGTHGLQYAAVAAAATCQVATGTFYPVTGGAPYICSAFIFTGTTRPVGIGVAWYDGAQVLIGLTSPAWQASTPNSWLPITNTLAAPGNAAFAQVVVFASNVQAGDLFTIDTVYFTQSDTQILVDWINPPFAPGGLAGNAFMDCSPWVRLDQEISYSRGRQDAVSEIQAGNMAFVMQNDNGEFTRNGTVTIPGQIGGTVTGMRRVQYNLADETGTWWTRFDGPLSEIDYTYDNTGNTCVAHVSVTDILSCLSRQDPLFCWTKEAVLGGAPSYHWTLNDPGNVGGTGVAAAGGFGAGAETSGSNGPPMRLSTSDSSNTAAIKWQDTSGGVETLADASKPGAPDGSEFWTPGLNQPSQPNRGLDSGNVGPYTTPIPSVFFTPKLTAQSAQNTFIGNTGYMLSAELPQPLTPWQPTGSFSLECWVAMDPNVGKNLGANYGPYVGVSLGSSRTYNCLVAGVQLHTGNYQWFAASYTQPPAFRGLNWPGSPPPSVYASCAGPNVTADTAKVPHHIVIVVTPAWPAATPLLALYVDNVLIGSFSLPPGQTFDTVCVGGAFGGTGSWYGNVSLVSIYPYALTPYQIAQNCQLGQHGMWETTADDCIAQIASYASIPSFWSNVAAQHLGLTLTEYADITGSNALANMQTYEQAEAGLLYVNSGGALTFHTRDWRMGYGAPDLPLPSGSFSGDMQYEMVDQFQSNEFAVSSPATAGANAAFGSGGALSTGPTNAVTPGVLQAAYINLTSQQSYGTYATSPASAPVTMPLVTWNRAYSALPLPGVAYQADPNLTDRAAWQANSRGDPWFMPAQLVVDLLTIANDPLIGLGPSNFFALDIDNMIASTGAAPASFPGTAGANEWFIEGITEVKNVTTHTIQFFCSPAAPQRAWVPGDPAYGVLGTTTRLGVSQADLSVVQADGKDVAHDAGAPYWPPTFSGVMNNPDGAGNSFVGAADMRGIAANLQDLLTPVMLNAGANVDAQAIGTGALSNPTLFWDFIHVDTEGGMGAAPGYPNWYLVTKPGWYEIDANVTWSLTAAQAGYAAQAWVVVAQGAAQALAAGTGTPLTVGRYVCPVGDATNMNSANMTPVNAISTRMYLGLGDMVAVAAEQNFTASRNTSTGGAGCMLSLVRTGIGTADDRTEVNSSISSGGTVTIPVKGTLKQAVFANTHTYSYQGKTGFKAYGRRNSDLNCYQGQNGSLDAEGSQVSQIQFDASKISSTLTGHQVQSAVLSGTNIGSWYATGARLLLGTTTATPGATTFQPTGSNASVNLMRQKFQQGQQLAFIIPVSMVTPFVTGGQRAFIAGDSVTTNVDYYGFWQGGPGSWTLTVNYV